MKDEAIGIEGSPQISGSIRVGTVGRIWKVPLVAGDDGLRLCYLGVMQELSLSLHDGWFKRRNFAELMRLISCTNFVHAKIVRRPSI
jgi:hypothetical protein